MVNLLKEKLSKKTKTKNSQKQKKEKDCSIILLNDPYTTMDFVENEILSGIFNLRKKDAKRITLAVHNNGSGIIGVFPRDTAIRKIEQVHLKAAAYEFPLKCILQEC
ncbi:MAG: ATP-dependent Clp protease adaptor ClpS [Treponema sp.]|nr:ATP-dependent Clp protease adaptor ClpS [Treponema sp.]